MNSSASSVTINIDGLEKLYFVERLQERLREEQNAALIKSVAQLLYSDAKPFELFEIAEAIRTLSASSLRNNDLPDQLSLPIHEAFREAHEIKYQYLPRSTLFDTAAHSLERLREAAPTALEEDCFLLFDMGDPYDQNPLEQQIAINSLFKEAIINNTEEIIDYFCHPGKPVKIGEVAAISASTFKDNYRDSDLVDAKADIYHYALFYESFVTRQLQRTVRPPLPEGAGIPFCDLLERKARDPRDLIQAITEARLAESIPNYEGTTFSTIANTEAAVIFWNQVYLAIEKKLENEVSPIEKDVFRRKFSTGAIYSCLTTAQEFSPEYGENWRSDPDTAPVYNAAQPHSELFAENARNHLSDIFRR